MFTWITDREALLAQFEALARTAYSRSDPKDPVDCSLYYLALRKKAVLQGLWRMATWSREQAATTRLLKNDFTDPRWKTAAAKNAYALMGKRRFEYAAAFFLLSDDLKSAVGVLSNQLGEPQLAIAVARVYGGDTNNEVLTSFVQSRLLPQAAREGNRWQATWAYWFLGQRSLAVRALISPLHSLLTPPGQAAEELLRAKSFLNDDPALVVLYQQLRSKSLQTLKGALMIKGQEEWEFVTKTAGLLLRMGCDILALDLVRNWEFLQQQQPVQVRRDEEIDEQESKESIADLGQWRAGHPAHTSQEIAMDPRKLLRRRSSLVVADLPEAATRANPENGSENSILDMWGVRPAPPQQRTSLLDDWDSPAAPKQEPPPKSALDGFSMDATPKRQEPTPLRSMLDDFAVPPQSKSRAPATSMLDDWDTTAVPAKDAAPRSMLADYDHVSPPKTSMPARSLLDEYDTSAQTKKSQAPKSMLDDWGTTPGPSDSDAAPVRSMLDDFNAPVPLKKEKPQPRSMLDGFENATVPAESAVVETKPSEGRDLPTKTNRQKDDNSKNGNVYSEQKADEGIMPRADAEIEKSRDIDLSSEIPVTTNGKPKEEVKEKEQEKEKDNKESKQAPTQFREPDPNSLLDAFGF